MKKMLSRDNTIKIQGMLMGIGFFLIAIYLQTKFH